MPDADVQFSISKVKAAGKILRDQEPGSNAYGDALQVFQYWRNCHTVPLNQFYESPQEYALAESPLTYVVHRPKRVEAVIKKLSRSPDAQLSTLRRGYACSGYVARWRRRWRCYADCGHVTR